VNGIKSSNAPIYQSYRGKSAHWNPHFIIKRVFDVLVCGVGLLLLLPFLALIIVLIRLDSPGGAIFTQERIGRRGRRFKIYKFRTMSAGYDNEEHRKFMQDYIAGQVGGGTTGSKEQIFKPPVEQAYTRVGRVLRKLSLDALPQLLNVLKGEMSLVGPRPNVPWEVEKYQLWHLSRLDVLPGITGLAQINGRSSLRFDEIVRYDILYVMHYSFWSDLEILWKTVGNVFTGRGAG